ncbi:MAG: AI-2E family transporter [Treponema sp.]|jgi:predicted PurR-regulated permease PerM|nr:AI-2E family transporter [Treponema sp.]
MNDVPTPSAEIPPPERIQNYVFGVILILLLLVVCRLFAPFFTVLLWSTMFYVLLSPLHHRLIKRLDPKCPKGIILKNMWSAVFAVGTVIIILIPLLFVSFQCIVQIIDLIRVVREVFYTKPDILADLFRHITEFIRDITAGQVLFTVDDIQVRILGILSSSLQDMIHISSDFAWNVGSFFFSLVLIMFSLFFFYMDAPYLSHLVLHAIPIRKTYLSALVVKFMDITRNLFLGYIIVAFIQAIMGYIIFSIFQIKGALVFAVLTFICVFIPMIGGGLVWAPLGIIRIIGGDMLGGILFLIVSGIFISILDNFLRPMFLRDRIQLHPLIIFFAILGGVSAFGFNGLILGPMVVILFLTVLDLFLTEHKMETD